MDMRIGKINKKGLSEIVGYVLLVVIAITLSLLVYAWLKNYLPKETKECPEGLSIMIKEYSCNSETNEINLTLSNNGLFNIDGFIARYSNSSGSLPINNLVGHGAGVGAASGEGIFNIPINVSSSYNSKYKYLTKIYEVSIIPRIIYKKDYLLCTKAEIRQKIEGCE